MKNFTFKINNWLSISVWAHSDIEARTKLLKMGAPKVK